MRSNWLKVNLINFDQATVPGNQDSRGKGNIGKSTSSGKGIRSSRFFWERIRETYGAEQ